MAELNPPSYLTNGCYTPQQDRLLWDSLICGEGVIELSSGSLRVSASSPAGMSVDVAAGKAWVQGDSVDNQGMYFVANDASVTLPVTTADPTDARIDSVVATILDGDYTGDPNDGTWELRVIAGSPSPTPVPPTLPASTLELAQVLVPGGATSITAGNITDTRVRPSFCGGYETGIEGIPSGANLDNYVSNGVFYAAPDATAQSITNWPNYYGQSSSIRGQYQGFLEVMEFPLQEVVQRISTFGSENFINWERHCTGSGTGTWGPWFQTAGPGRWAINGVYDINTNQTPFTFTGNSTTPGGTVVGMRRTGNDIEVAFHTSNNQDIAINSNGNIPSPEPLVATITNESFRPIFDVYINAFQYGFGEVRARVGSDGRILLTHGRPNSTITAGDGLDFQGRWPARPNS